MLCTYEAIELSEQLRVACLALEIDAELYIAPYGQLEQEVLDGASRLSAFGPTYVLIAPTTADLASGCYNVYETADGQWLALGALESKFWKGFCERIERPDLIPLQHTPGPERTRPLRSASKPLATEIVVQLF